ncbi:MAG TPA: hypothetical protein VFM88_05850 [Vicinamibacteria bacterium]|nr:hypothetical protein [Vicinamibacteria bacterium]
MKVSPPLLLLLGILRAAGTAAQELQDELDLQANANFVQGSGARAFGMGGAFLARPDDATAASWNPAGLSYLRAPELSLVYLGSDFDVELEPVRGGIQTDNRRSHYPDFAAFTWPWTAKSLSGSLQLSYQRVLPFKTDRTITLRPQPGNDAPNEVRTIDSTGGFDTFALGTGVQVTRKLRLGLTLNRWFNGYDQTRLRPDLDVPSRQESDLELHAWNVHVGAIVSPMDSLNVGFVLKTGFEAKAVLRRVRWDEYDDGANTRINTYSRDDVRIKLPGALGAGVSWRPLSNLTLSADYTRTHWSTGEIRNFFTLARAFPSGPPARPSPPQSGDFCGVYGPDDPPPRPGVTPCPPVLPYPTLEGDQQDTNQVRAGLEFVLLKPRLKVPLRAGYFRDSQFFPSLGGDAPTFDGFTVGTGLIVANVLFDVAYVYESGRYSDANGIQNDVTFQKAYASVIYRFSRRP